MLLGVRYEIRRLPDTGVIFPCVVCREPAAVEVRAVETGRTIRACQRCADELSDGDQAA
jgi:hypothetical protein